MPAENLQEVKDFLETNKDAAEVQEWMAGQNPITNDRVTDYLTNNDEGKNYLKMHNSEFLANFKTSDEFKGLISKAQKDAIAELDPDKNIDENILWARKFRAEQEKNAKIADIKKEALADIPDHLKDMASMLITEDKDISLQLVKKFKTLYEEQITKEVDERFKSKIENPHNSGNTEEVTKEMVEAAKAQAEKSGTEEDIMKYSNLKLQLAQQGGDK